MISMLRKIVGKLTKQIKRWKILDFQSIIIVHKNDQMDILELQNINIQTAV